MIHIPRSTFCLFSLLLTGACVLSLSVKAHAEYKKVNWESLDLTGSQRLLINEQNEQWRSVVSEIAPRIETNERKLKQMMSDSSTSEDDILRLQKAIYADKTKLKLQARRFFHNKKSVLNKEQQEKLDTMLNLDD